MVRKKQRPEETEEQDGWQKAKTLALIADVIARLIGDIFDKR
jgi:hypothetical protein